MSNAAENLSRIADMAEVLAAQRERVEDAEHKLGLEQAALRQIEEIDFPELMRECELTEVKLRNGITLKLVDDVKCGITAENKAFAYAWMREHGFGGLIKTALNVPFSRDEESVMNRVANAIVEMGRAVDKTENVHPQTLKSFVKEQLEAGNNLPDSINIFTFSKVVAKERKS